MGLTPEELYSTSLYDFNAMSEAFELEDSKMWHKVRVLASIVTQPHLKKGIRPQDLIPLPNDIKAPTMSKEQVEKDVEAKTKIFLNRRNGNDC